MTHATQAIPTRATSVQVTRAESEQGRLVAEDMHGIECFIDARTAIEPTASLGMIIEAVIDHDGWVVRGKPSLGR